MADMDVSQEMIDLWGVSVDDVEDDSSIVSDDKLIIEGGKGIELEIKYDSPKKREKRLEFWLRQLKKPSSGPIDTDTAYCTLENSVIEQTAVFKKNFPSSNSYPYQKNEYFQFSFKSSTSPCSVHREAVPHTESEQCHVVSYEIELNILGFVVQVEKHSIDFKCRIHVVNQSLSLSNLQQQMKWDLLDLLSDFHASPKASINELVHFLKVLCTSYSKKGS